MMPSLHLFRANRHRKLNLVERTEGKSAKLYEIRSAFISENGRPEKAYFLRVSHVKSSEQSFLQRRGGGGEEGVSWGAFLYATFLNPPPVKNDIQFG